MYATYRIDDIVLYRRIKRAGFCRWLNKLVSNTVMHAGPSKFMLSALKCVWLILNFGLCSCFGTYSVFVARMLFNKMVHKLRRNSRGMVFQTESTELHTVWQKECQPDDRPAYGLYHLLIMFCMSPIYAGGLSRAAK